MPCPPPNSISGTGAKITLLRMKVDLKDEVAVFEDDAEEQAQVWRVPHIGVSSKTGQNIESIFEDSLWR
jgi:hypothetical protein